MQKTKSHQHHKTYIISLKQLSNVEREKKQETRVHLEGIVVLIQKKKFAKFHENHNNFKQNKQRKNRFYSN